MEILSKLLLEWTPSVQSEQRIQWHCVTVCLISYAGSVWHEISANSTHSKSLHGTFRCYNNTVHTKRKLLKGRNTHIALYRLKNCTQASSMHHTPLTPLHIHYRYSSVQVSNLLNHAQYSPSNALRFSWIIEGSWYLNYLMTFHSQNLQNGQCQTLCIKLNM